MVKIFDNMKSVAASMARDDPTSDHVQLCHGPSYAPVNSFIGQRIRDYVAATFGGGKAKNGAKAATTPKKVTNGGANGTPTNGANGTNGTNGSNGGNGHASPRGVGKTTPEDSSFLSNLLSPCLSPPSATHMRVRARTPASP